MAKADEFTAEGLREVATDEYGTYILHRHGGDHTGAECWCHPLVLTYAQLACLSKHDLQEMLDVHYRIH